MRGLLRFAPPPVSPTPFPPVEREKGGECLEGLLAPSEEERIGNGITFKLALLLRAGDRVGAARVEGNAHNPEQCHL